MLEIRWLECGIFFRGGSEHILKEKSIKCKFNTQAGEDQMIACPPLADRRKVRAP